VVVSSFADAFFCVVDEGVGWVVNEDEVAAAAAGVN
jgi:hypothetical protein